MVLGFFVFLGIFSVILFASAVRTRRLHYLSTPNRDSAASISVIIPFRNEKGNLPHLIKSILEQSSYPHQIVFVDDHSDDEGIQLLERAFNGLSHISIFTLPPGYIGKKQAINLGVVHATGNYCLTLDADVIFQRDYFQSLSESVCADMLISPVVMNSTSVWSSLFAFEYMMFNAFNFMFSSLYINSASGANLLFSRKKYLELNTLKSHDFLSSGDDHFLLRDFQNADLNIKVTNEPTIAVQTKSAENWGEYFNQRIRWFSKTKSRSNIKEVTLGFVLTMYLIGSYVVSVYFLFQNEFSLLFGIIGVRFLIDLFVFSFYTSRLVKLNLFIWYPIYFGVYPFIFAFVLLGSLLYSPTWKGRPVIRKE
jgi:glycosyltransferase involved in cell wall biosynthesis